MTSRGWLIKELDFEKTVDENLFQLSHAECVLGRLDAARALVNTAKDKPEVAQALAAAWKREMAARAQQEILELMCNGEETFRSALIEAAKFHEARARVAAIEGLIKLKHDHETETLLRAAWANNKEAYGARRAALRGLVAWKVKDAEKLLSEALKLAADHHSIAATALEIMLETPGSKSRELAALYSKYGQPERLRSSAIGAFTRLAKDDPALQDVLVDLVNDHDPSVRSRAWTAARELGVKKAVPALKARLAREIADFGGHTRRKLEEAITAIEAHAVEPKSQSPATAEAGKIIAELERQAAELERKSQELIGRIAALKLANGQGSAAKEGTAPAATSNTSH